MRYLGRAWALALGLGFRGRCWRVYLASSSAIELAGLCGGVCLIGGCFEARDHGARTADLRDDSRRRAAVVWSPARRHVGS